MATKKKQSLQLSLGEPLKDGDSSTVTTLISLN